MRMITTNDNSDKEKEITQTSEDDSEWYGQSRWPGDEDGWVTLLEPVLQESSEFADELSRLWLRLVEEIESGPQGARWVVDSLETALRVSFRYTKVYGAAFELYRLSLGGDAGPKEEPLKVIRKAIKRIKKRI
jgi:hypothetical protein